jgi:hypothetical protein
MTILNIQVYTTWMIVKVISKTVNGNTCMGIATRIYTIVQSVLLYFIADC